MPKTVFSRPPILPVFNYLRFKQLRPSCCTLLNGLELGGTEQLHFYLQCRKIWMQALGRRTGMAGDSDNGKQELHQLIEQLPPEQVTAALRYMHYLCADPVLLSLLNAPPDDEPYTDEQRQRDRRRQRHFSRRSPPRVRSLKLSFVWAPSARVELRRIERETAMRILLALTRYAETGEGDL
jgi:hypothetical protein